MNAEERVRPDSFRVAELRGSIGLISAQRVALRESLHYAVLRAGSVEDLKPVLRALIDKALL